MIDVNALIGPYPFRHVPSPTPDALVQMLEREQLDQAWVGHLPSAFHRDPTAGNADLYRALEPHSAQLRPVPTVRPDWPDWERHVDTGVAAGAVAVRAYPPQWGLGAHDARLSDLALACGERRLPLLLTVRFEDLRQRDRLDVAGDLDAATIRALARAGEAVRLIVTAAGRSTIEEVQWGLTPAERRRVFWDISWIWGPPEDHLHHLIGAIGAERFLFGTHWPLRLSQTPRANLDLLPDALRPIWLGDPRRVFDDAPA